MNSALSRFLAVSLLSALLPFLTLAAEPPKVGAPAPDFTLKNLTDETVKLSELTATGNVVLVVLRGWPGYQCPLCTKQVRDFSAAAAEFARAGARVVMVYPGPSDKLKAHAQEFLTRADWPKDFIMVIDPDFAMVNAYGLRWEAKSETAYPSTFIIDRKGIVRTAKVSHSHGDRSVAHEVAQAAAALLP